MWDLGNILGFFKTHFSRSNVVLGLPSHGSGHQRGAQRMAATLELEVVTGNYTLGLEKAEVMAGAGTESPGTIVLDVPVEGPGASDPQDMQAGLGMTRAELEQGPLGHVAELQTDKLEQPEGQRLLTKRDTGAAGFRAEFLAEKNLPRGASGPRRVGRSSQQLASVPEGRPEAGAGRGRGQWLQVLEGDFSHLDVSLCVVLYSLSFMGLLAVYTYFRARMRALKGHASHPAA